MDKQLPVSAWEEWKIVEKIGEGSYGKVYKACREEQGKSFYSAIKVITIPSSQSELNGVRSENSDEKSVKAYFYNLVEECIQEVSTMEYFRGNSHVVSVEDYKVVEYLDDIGWDIYIRMEYLTSFQEYCAGHKMTEEDVVNLGIDLCRALEYCQKQNIIHRDIKPENIFVSRFGEFKLGDFGIARELDRSKTELSQKGTFSYMAPEMYRGEDYDARVDIYSLGLVLYKLRNRNRLPFINLEKQLITYRDKENALNKRMSGEKPAPPKDAGDAFARVILKACAFERDERYQTAEEFRKALEKVKNHKIPGQKKYVQKSQKQITRRQTEPDEKTIRRIQGQKRKTSRKKAADRRGQTALIAAVIVMIASICVVIGVFVWLMKENAELQRLKQSVTETVQSAENKQLQSTLKDIRDKATEITENLNSYSWIGSEEEGKICYMNQDDAGSWETMKVLIYPSQSDDGCYEEYFYWDQELIFVYVWEIDNTVNSSADDSNTKAELYYFDSGEMIRWIDENNVCHDNETDNEEYLKREQKYLNRAEVLQ